MKNSFLVASLGAIVMAGSAVAAVLVDTTYSSDFSTSASWFAEDANGGASSTNVTWTINSGVTVTGGRYFIGSIDGDGVLGDLAIFTVNGGGTLNIIRNGTYNLRVGQNNSSEAGQIVISGGSTVLVSGTTAGEFMHQTGGSIELDGIGSTFAFNNAPTTGARAYSALTSTTGSYTGQAIASGTAIPFQLSAASVTAGHSILSSSIGGITSVTVVPEPSAAALVGLAGLGLIARRRR